MTSLKERIQLVQMPRDWLNSAAAEYHYMHKRVHPKAMPFGWGVTFDGAAARPDGIPCGFIIFSSIHFTKLRGEFGYDGSAMYLNEETQFSFQVDEEGLERLKRLVPNAHVEGNQIAFHVDDEELERVKQILAAEFGVQLLLNTGDDLENNTELRSSEMDSDE